MRKKQQKTLRSIFTDPVPSNIKWDDIESLLMYLGAEISEGRGSRVRFALNEEKMTFHRPHPQPDTDKAAVKSVRRFLENAGIYDEL